MQRALIQYRNPKNYYLVKEALIKAHREDLIGSGPKCLIRAIAPRSDTAPRYGKPPAAKPSRPTRKTGKPTPSGHTGKKPAAKAAPKKPGRRKS